MTLSPNQQMAELLVLKSVCGLDPQEQQQLDRLQRESKVSESEFQNEMDRVDLAAAAADLASFSSVDDAMPEHLKNCVLVEAGKFLESRIEQPYQGMSDEPVVTRYQANDSGVNGWMIGTIVATAASILLLLNAMNADKTPPSSPQLTVAQKMANFLSSNPADLMDVEMVKGFDPTGAGLTNGRVVWSDTLQEGYMDFTGLAINNPKDEAYQLWIFESPDQKYPIDGGVFNITKARQIIPIDAKIKAKAMLFGVTVEKPDGVVVSDRMRIATADPTLAAAVSKLLAEQAKENQQRQNDPPNDPPQARESSEPQRKEERDNSNSDGARK